MNYDLAPGFRHIVAPNGTQGTGVELEDGRVLYVWVDAGGQVRRGWIESVDVLVSNDEPPMSDVDVLGAGGAHSIAYIGGRPVMIVVHKNGTGSSTPTTGSAFLPSLAVGFHFLESNDDGETWTLVGSGSVGNTGSSIGLGEGVEAGEILDVGGGVLLAVANYFGNYFGDSTPNPGIYRSSDGGASWAPVHTPDGGAFSGQFSRNIAVDNDGVLWWGDKGGGIGTPFLHVWSSSDGGATWVDRGSPSGEVEVDATFGFDAAKGAWTYAGNGYLTTATPNHAGTQDRVVDKITTTLLGPYPNSIGMPLLRSVSRGRTIAFGGHWVDLLTVSSGWQINRMKLGGGTTGG